MRTLLDIVRSLILNNPAVFTWGLLNSSLSRSVFHDKLLCLDQSLSESVVVWLLCSEPGPTQARAPDRCGADLLLVGDVTRILLSDCGCSVVTRRHAEFHNAEFANCAETTLDKSVLTSLSVVSDNRSSNFFSAFQHCQSLVTRLKRLRIMERRDKYEGWQNKLRKRFFSTLLKSKNSFCLEDVDLCLDSASYKVSTGITSFLHEKCSRTLRRLRTRHMFLWSGYSFPALEHLHVVDDVFVWDTPRLDCAMCFPSVRTLYLQNIAEHRIDYIYKAFSHVANIEVIQ